MYRLEEAVREYIMATLWAEKDHISDIEYEWFEWLRNYNAWAWHYKGAWIGARPTTGEE